MKTRKLPELSIFFPAYNEEGNIVAAVEQALKVAPMVADKFEVIVINDGSKDKTRNIVEAMAIQNSHVRLVNQRNKGYGGAVKWGLKEAKYEWVFYTDADLQFDMEELPKMVTKVANIDMVIGYRIRRAEGWKRALVAKMLKVWNRFWLGFPTEIKDIDCAFKLINRKVINQVMPLASDGAMVTSELLLLACRAGFAWTQVPVHHYPRRQGKPTGNNLRVVGKAIRETFILLGLTWRDRIRTSSIIRLGLVGQASYTGR